MNKTEYKTVRLQDHPFFLDLCSQGLVFRDTPQDYETVIVAFEDDFGWAAYFRTPYTQFQDTLRYGSKLPEDVARQLFSGFSDKKYRH